ncbi:MAG: hypothetical protein K8H87_18130 [Pseudorhodoplanes sp.]|nr:hypothetical protein [Pseudorhodoplanes sp.]
MLVGLWKKSWSESTPHRLRNAARRIAAYLRQRSDANKKPAAAGSSQGKGTDPT